MGPCKNKYCNHCGHDNHNNLDCKYKGQTKCPDCDKFHEGQECWKKNNKWSWKGKEKENSSNTNKKCKEAHNTEGDLEEQANIAKAEVHGQFECVSETIEVNAPTNFDIANSNECEDLVHKVETYVNVIVSDSEYQDLDSYEWVADSASTVHITHQRDAFATYGLISKISVIGIGGMKVFAIGIGTIYLSTEYKGTPHTFQLNDVLHIPSTLRNLISIPLWEDPKGRGAHFEDH